MMDSDLKKWAEKAASILLAALFLKVPQAICIDGTDNKDADDGAADDNADDDADVDAGNDAVMPDNNATRRRWMTMQTTMPRLRQRAMM